MPDANETSNWLRGLVFSIGTVIGLGVELATIHMRRDLTRKEVILKTLATIAAAFFLFWILLYLNVNVLLANGVSILCAKFSHEIVALGWKWLKKGFGIEDDEKK